VRLTQRPVPALPAHAVSLLDQVRAAQADTGSMSDVVKRARQAYGSSLNGFNRDFIIPLLRSRGLIEERRILFLRHYKRTLAGDAEESCIAADIARARGIPELLRSNPAEVAALVVAVGGTILLVNELRPYFRQISEVMRPPGTGVDYLDSSGGDASLPCGIHRTRARLILATPCRISVPRASAASTSARSTPAHSTRSMPEWPPSMQASMPRSATAAEGMVGATAEEAGTDAAVMQ